MAVFSKQLIQPTKRRTMASSFGWADHALVREHLLARCSATAWGLYLFLVLVADADGMSYWGDRRITELLRIDRETLHDLRDELQRADVLAYEKPMYQLLAVPRRDA